MLRASFGRRYASMALAEVNSKGRGSPPVNAIERNRQVPIDYLSLLINTSNAHLLNAALARCAV